MSGEDGAGEIFEGKGLDCFVEAEVVEGGFSEGEEGVGDGLDLLGEGGVFAVLEVGLVGGEGVEEDHLRLLF